MEPYIPEAESACACVLHQEKYILQSQDRGRARGWTITTGILLAKEFLLIPKSRNQSLQLTEGSPGPTYSMKVPEIVHLMSE